MKIGEFDLAAAQRPMIVAEIAASHNGSLDTAIALIRAAKAAGADAIKTQAYTPDTLTGNFPRPEFTIQEGPWKGRHLYELYTAAQTPRDWFPQLYATAWDCGIDLFPSVFSIEDIEFVKQFNPHALKIASFELVDPILIKAAMWEGKPLIISTGMAVPAEIIAAANVVQRHPAIWLHCISDYPVRAEDANLNFMDALRREFSFVGFSDHSLGWELAQMAVRGGACLIEKHITLTPGGDGPDDGFASGPDDFALFVKAVHRAAVALGPPAQGWTANARSDMGHAPLRRSLYVMEDVVEGALFNPINVRSIRPGLGLAPSYYPRVIGARAAMDIPAGTPLAEHMVLEMK